MKPRIELNLDDQLAAYRSVQTPAMAKTINKIKLRVLEKTFQTFAG